MRSIRYNNEYLELEQAFPGDHCQIEETDIGIFVCTRIEPDGTLHEVIEDSVNHMMIAILDQGEVAYA